MSNLLLGLSILIVGDSHMATPRYLITTLHDELMTQGAKVDSFGACGLSPGAWVIPRTLPCGGAQRIGGGPVMTIEDKTAKSKSIDDLIGQYHPNLVIVEIGDTIASYNSKELPRQTIRESVESLTYRISAHKLSCIWIGPSWGSEGGPYFKTFVRVKELSDYLKSIVTPCEYVDSLALSKPGEWGTFDGQHHTSVGYQKWGAALEQSLVQTATIHALVKH